VTVIETPSGGRIVFAAILGVAVERSAKRFETFIAPDV
jgi:hypothetical protein